MTKVVFDLNDQVRNLIDKVDRVFTYDDDVCSTVMYSIIEHPDGQRSFIERHTAMKTLKKNTTAQISIYPMPNGKYAAVCYPCSVKVNYDVFEDEMRKLFKHVDRRNWASNMYSFYLCCVKNGYKGKLPK